MSPRWLHWPAAAAATEVVGTCTGWFVSPSNPIRSAIGWAAGSSGPGSNNMDLRSDSFGAFLTFDSGPEASNFISLHGSRNITITHTSGTYVWNNSSGGGMSIFATTSVKLSLAGWSGTLPGASDSAIVTLS